MAECIVEEDLPGHYLIVHNSAAIREGLSLDSPVVGQLAAGEVVHVLEVVPLPEANRVRGKLEHPHGWISLVDLQDGYRWAVRQETAPGDPWALEKAHLVAEIKSRDAEIQRWTLLAERLRAEYQRSMENATELAAVVEERVLKGHRISAQTAFYGSSSITPFAQSTKAREMQELALKLGIAVPEPKKRPVETQEEVVDPAYRLPPGLPPGSKVVGFRRKPSKEEHEVPTGSVEGRVLDSNAIMQPSKVHYAGDPLEAVGVYPLARPPVSMATTNLLDRPLTAKAEEKWSYDGDFQAAPSIASVAPGPRQSSECSRAVSERAASVKAGTKRPETLESAARAIVSILQ